MTTPVDKSKARGYFKFILAIDTETTGLFINSDMPDYDPTTGKYHQILSIGLIVLDEHTGDEIDRVYVEVKWDGKSEWSAGAEKVHGLTKQYLEQNGVTEEHAVELIGELILKYWGPTNKLCLLGHNVATFDLWFFRSMFRRHGIELRFGNRHIDTFSLAQGTVGAFNSDDLFETIGMDTRGAHNAMDDIVYTVEAYRMIRRLWNSKVQLKTYEY